MHCSMLFSFFFSQVSQCACRLALRDLLLTESHYTVTMDFWLLG